MKKFLLTFSIHYFLFSIFLSAQPSQQLSSSQIQLALEKLNVAGSVLYIAAHPDDENTRLLSYLANEKHYRTGYLSLTRGDGGQNLIGDEQGEELGLIRTQELLAARRVDGAEQFFTRAFDFGYTKNPDETFQFWDKEKILSDVVFVIRKFQPDIIICRFPTTGEGGHGQHTASAIIAQEAFAAAADPNEFPEQLQYVKVWQAKRLLWNTFNFGGTNMTAPNQLQVDVGGYNALLGKSYGELQAESRSQHKSQGMGTAKTRGSQIEYFKTILGDSAKVDLMDGIETSWKKISSNKKISELIVQIAKEFQPENPSASVEKLLQLRNLISVLPDGVWKTQKLKETDNLILACAGIWLEATCTDKIYSAGDSIRFKVQTILRSNISASLKEISFQNFDTTFNKNLEANKLLTYQHKQFLSASTIITEPYWLMSEKSGGMYEIPLQQFVGLPENPSPPTVTITLQFGNNTIQFSKSVSYKYTDPVKGEMYQPMVIAPQVMVNIESPVYVYSSYISKSVKVRVTSAMNNMHCSVQLHVPNGWRVTPEAIDVGLLKKGDENEVNFFVSTPDMNLQSSVDSLKAVVEFEGKEYSEGIKTISYDHIPSITYFPPAKSKLVTVDLKTTGKNIGYIKGAGDMIPELLGQLGYHVVMLSDEDLAIGRLQSYDAIITGVRAFNTNEDVVKYHSQLMNYVQQGGTLLVQYNTTANLLTTQIGPYPFKITSDRVTNENADVNFINANDPILNSPNKITSKDFEGWIQERGLYFVSDADSNYRKIFTINDAGEKPLDGSLIVAKYGEGKFVYTSLSFFRELPSGVPGAIRLFVNLISK